MHTRINSLLHEHKAKKRPLHSHSKKQKNLIEQSSQLFAPEHFITDFLTYPAFTEGNPPSQHLTHELRPLRKKKSRSGNRQGEKSPSLSEKKRKSKSKEKKSFDRLEKIPSKQKSNKKKKPVHQPKKKPIKNNHPLPVFNYSKKLSPDPLSKAFRATRANSKQTRQFLGQNWQQILQQYGECLTAAEIDEIKEYKNIYFLGKIKQRKNKNLFSSRRAPLSAREKEMNERGGVEVVGLMTERKVEGEGKGRTEEGNADDQFYKYEVGDHIAYRYQIIQSINSGAFGQVVKVYDHKAKELQALKIVKKCQELVQQTLVEITILSQIREKDKQNLSGIVKIKDFTIFRKHICIAFELLQGNLYEFVAANNHCGLTENAIRIFAVQLLNSLSFLKQEGIIHCDIKPENIVMKKWGKSGIKLIDFGTSCMEGKQIYEYLQSRFYRSPQIIFRSPYSFPIDMWSLGCILAELKLGQPLFPANEDVQHLLFISKSIGFPQQHHGEYSAEFCKSDEIKEITEKYYLEEYELIKDKEEVLKEHPFFSKSKYLRRSMKTLQERLNEDGKSGQFCDFIAKILAWEPERRLKPEDALQHPWIADGIPKEVKEVYTFFTSRQKSKDSKHKKSHSKSKSLQKKSTGKTNIKKKGSKMLQKSPFGPKKRQKSVQLQSKRSVCLTKKRNIL